MDNKKMNTLKVKLPSRSYDIYIKKGIIKNIGTELRKIYKNKKIAIITDENIEKIYGEEIRNNLKQSNFSIKTVVIKAGEKSKSLKVLEDVYNELLDFGITRSDLILTFGGGVVGDLGGFAASTLLRGINFLQIPTSLLAQIDSSVGGKVAINLEKGKNLVGSFYHPKAVYIDPNLLETLDKRFFYDGMAEVIKYGCIRDKELFEKLLEYDTKDELMNNIEEIIYSCLSIKKEIVERDEKDTGERMLLNFGHTFGHVIEKYFNYEKYTHGEAVAMGMYHITKKSEDMGLTEKGTAKLIEKILSKYKLQHNMVDMNKDKMIEIIGLDKKNEESKINMIFLKEIGHSFIKKINKEEIEKYL